MGLKGEEVLGLGPNGQRVMPFGHEIQNTGRGPECTGRMRSVDLKLALRGACEMPIRYS